ncbi:MAG: alpha-ketoacid dehydrogenase subunit beta [Candidatus Aenigmarchaeota archaeon]|nr:alpha-ketoacid dehydrogenase subunit beta [Candidatus Aenigmarchaeota archaeon]
MTTMNIVQAVNLALREEMERDDKVLVLGEDVGKNGGVFRATEGLFQLYGEDRVIDTPLSELGIVGTSIGLALGGMKPVAEIQFDGFIYGGFDQIVSHMSRIRNRTRGRFNCHLVIRVPYGGGIKALEHHSETPEVYFAHVPGIKVVIPSTPYDAKGLLTAAIRDPDPVIFFEPKRIYRAIKEDVPETDYTVPIGKANVRKEGNDVTLIAWGSMVRTCMDAAEKMKGEADCEVIDVRTISPLDTETLLASAKKTGRVVIVHEAPRSFGVGAEISARISEREILSLEAPIVRVTGYDVVTPYSKLEDYYIPDSFRVVRAIKQVMSF